MKKVLFTAFLFVAGLSLQAQTGPSVGINAGIPTGDASDVSGFSLGIDFTYLWSVSDKFDAGAAVGFSNAFGKEIDTGLGSIQIEDIQFLPVAVAGRAHLTEDFSAGVDLGYAVGINDGNDGGFYYRPMVGYSLSEKLGLSLSYTGISLEGDFNWNTINLGLMLAL
ncbi:outer membrane beta-barrel protein [Muriicola sp. E247]|uniref:outer membrane beta-barrel protein n=1 Tax=Muriicola sp. E247 TaxID=3242730 RepID=UPI003523FE58